MEFPMATAKEQAQRPLGPSARSGSYVGREALRALLAGCVAACRAGRGDVLLLEGEAGIGKTRTLELLEELAHGAGLRTVKGRCSEVPGAPPLLPWTQVLAELPAKPPEPDGAEARDDDGARLQRLRAIAEPVLAAARKVPLLVTLDDLHAADLPSLQLLSFLAEEVQHAPLLVAGAWRHTDVRPAALRRALDELGRHAHVFRLDALGEEDVARLVARVGRSSVHGEVVRAVFERSLGNPLFATQLVELLAAIGFDLSDPATAGEAAQRAPAGVLAVLRGRLERVAADALPVLRLAAVFGRDFDADLVEAALAALDPPVVADVDRSLDAAAAAHIARPAAAMPGRWRFAHVLFRDALYEEQPPAARRALHRAAAVAVAARRDLCEDVWLAAAAHHSLEALEPETAARARELARRAGEQALARSGPDDAVAWFEAALRALEIDPCPAEREGESLALRLRLATARWRAGQPAAARDDFSRAIELARARKDAVALAEAAVGFAGRTDASLGPEEEARALLQEALDQLAPEPSRLRVDTLTRLASSLYFSEDEARREQVSLEAVACAEALGDPSALGYALTARHYVIARPGRLAERESIAERTLRVLEGRPEDAAMVIARFQSIWNGLERGDFGAVDQHLAVHASLAERLREPFLRWQHAALRATRILAGGDLDRGEALALRARALGEEAGSPNAFAWFAGQLYGLRRAQGRLGELEPLLGELTARYPDVRGYAFAQAESWLALGRSAEARAFFAAAAARGFRDLPLDFNWPSVVAIAARCLSALEDEPSAAALYDVLAPADGTCIVMPFGSLWDGAVALYLGQLATLLGRPEAAARHLAAAVDLHARIGARAHLADSWLAQARLAARGGERTDASRLAREAAALYGDLGMLEAAKQAAALARPSAARTALAVHRLSRTARGWRIGCGDVEVRLPPSVGLDYLAELLAHPGRPFHVLDLTARRDTAGAADSGALLDGRARAEVRARMHQLAARLEEAEERHDAGASETLRGELERLEDELARALGLGGRARRVGDPVERARKSVYNRIQSAIKRIEGELPELARHLRHGVRTGRTCVYAPESPLDWRVDG
jgi:tetratricopeptide (TPR) repeat protein